MRPVICALSLAAISFLASIFASAQIVPTTLFDFSGPDGQGPTGLVKGADGNFYGTTDLGGVNGKGSVFRITPAGKLSTIYSFCSQPNCVDGSDPLWGLVQGSDGSFYGVTMKGGAGNRILYPDGTGSIFKITATGTFTTLYSFTLGDGASPNSLMQGSDGNFYGTTSAGGGTTGQGAGGKGVVFKVTPAGEVVTLHYFCSLADCADGSTPSGGLVQGRDGSLYGTTALGGANDSGTVFKITTAGTLTTLYSFCSVQGVAGKATCDDGSMPYAWMVQGSDGSFYGTTLGGGANNSGTVFKITAAGILTTLYSFCSETNCADGSFASGRLLQAANGNLYGATMSTIFEITPTGTLATLYSSCTQGSHGNCADRGSPSGLVQGSDGNFYGTTLMGGAHGNGTVFRLNAPVAEAVLSTDSLTFDKVMVGVPSIPGKSVVLKNTGTGTLNITKITATEHFGISSTTCKPTLKMQQTCEMSVYFQSRTPGDFTGAVRISDSAANSPQIVKVQGTATKPRD